MQRPVVLLAVLLPAFGSPLRAQVTRDDVLSIQDGRFFLDGRPFAEISFNKFDLFWQLYGELAAGRTLDAASPMVQAQDRALRDLHEMGFRTIRIFALPWGPSGPAAYADPAKRQMLYAALDKTLELCDRYDIRLVWSLGAAAFTDTRLEPGKGFQVQSSQVLNDGDEICSRIRENSGVFAVPPKSHDFGYEGTSATPGRSGRSPRRTPES